MSWIKNGQYLRDSSTFMLNKSVNSGLVSKYQLSHAFYLTRPINEIILSYRKSSSYINYYEMRFLAQEIQCLKRMYFYKSQSRRPEIEQRLRLCGDYYAKSGGFSYQYPMVILTNTKHIFKNRMRRLRKIQAGQGSSDQTNQPQEQDQPKIQQQMSDILHELKEVSLSDMEIKQEQEECYSQFSYETNTQCIYNQSQINLYQSNISHTLSDQESRLHHLIQNMQENPEDVVIKNQKKVSNSGKVFLNTQNIPQSEKQSHISIVPIKQSFQKKTSIFDQYIDFVKARPNFTGLALKLENKAISSYTQSLAEPSLQDQRSQRANRRKKIRQKAQQLLKRVRSNEELQYNQT